MNDTTPTTDNPIFQKPDRPEQIVIPMSAELKNAIKKKCKEERTPVARKIRKVLQEWVDGKIDLPAATPVKSAPKANTASEA